MNATAEARWERAATRLDAASTAREQDRLDEALTLARGAAATLARVVGQRHPDYANARVELGRILRARGQLRFARAHLMVGAETLARTRGGGNVVAEMAAAALLELALCLQELGRFGECWASARAALRLAERLGPRSALVGQAHNQLGMAGKFSGRFAEAERHYRAARPIVRRLYGATSREMATLWHNLGGLEHARERFARGEPPARRAVEIARRRFPKDHPERLAHEVAHAALLDGLERHDEALPIYRRAVAAYTRCYGRAHYEVGTTLHNLAATERALGLRAAALRHYEEARRVLIRVRGADHPDVALTELNLGRLHAEVGHARVARGFLQRAHRRLRARLGARHPHTLACAGALGQVMRR
jgi:tetratricopeptide (TPR) repeat protein